MIKTEVILMKSFLEEYGFAILAAIIVIVLIMMVSPVGVAIRGSIDSVVLKFTGVADNGLDSATGNFGQLLNNIQEEEPSKLSINSENQYLLIYQLKSGVFDNNKTVCQEVIQDSHELSGVANSDCSSPFYKYLNDGTRAAVLYDYPEEEPQFGKTYYLKEKDLPTIENGVLYKYNSAGSIGYFTKDPLDGTYIEYAHYAGVLKATSRFEDDELIFLLRDGEITVAENNFTITRYSQPSVISVGDMSFGWRHVEEIGDKIKVCPIESDEQKEFFESIGGGKAYEDTPFALVQDPCRRFDLNYHVEWDNAGFWKYPMANPAVISPGKYN